MELDLNSANFVLTNNYNLGATGDYTSEFQKTIDLRQILGPAYDECDTFAICLNSVCSANFVEVLTVAGTPISSTIPVLLGITGLPFILNRPNSTNLALFPSFFQATGHPTLINAACRSFNFYMPRVRPILFKKPAHSTVTLTIGTYSFRNLQVPVFFRNTTGTLDISQTYLFTVFGIKKNLHKIK